MNTSVIDHQDRKTRILYDLVDDLNIKKRLFN